MFYKSSGLILMLSSTSYLISNKSRLRKSCRMLRKWFWRPRPEHSWVSPLRLVLFCYSMQSAWLEFSFMPTKSIYRVSVQVHNEHWINRNLAITVICVHNYMSKNLCLRWSSGLQSVISLQWYPYLEKLFIWGGSVEAFLMKIRLKSLKLTYNPHWTYAREWLAQAIADDFSNLWLPQCWQSTCHDILGDKMGSTFAQY